jgi:hypothetical protein
MRLGCTALKCICALRFIGDELNVADVSTAIQSVDEVIGICGIDE